jgi:flagellar biogenesis protein FliO
MIYLFKECLKLNAGGAYCEVVDTVYYLGVVIAALVAGWFVLKRMEKKFLFRKTSLISIKKPHLFLYWKKMDKVSNANIPKV